VASVRGDDDNQIGIDPTGPHNTLSGGRGAAYTYLRNPSAKPRITKLNWIKPADTSTQSQERFGVTVAMGPIMSNGAMMFAIGADLFDTASTVVDAGWTHCVNHISPI
jgi:hypothetical protein